MFCICGLENQPDELMSVEILLFDFISAGEVEEEEENNNNTDKCRFKSSDRKSTSQSLKVTFEVLSLYFSNSISGDIIIFLHYILEIQTFKMAWEG